MAAPFSQKSCSYDLQSRPPPFVHSSVSEQSKLDNYNSKPIGSDMIDLKSIRLRPQTFNRILPHDCELQEVDRDEDPEQVFPPCCGLGLLHDL